MKVLSIILLALAGFDLLFFFAALNYNAEVAHYYLAGVGMFGVIGAYLLKRAKDKEKEQKEKDKWEQGK